MGTRILLTAQPLASHARAICTAAHLLRSAGYDVIVASPNVMAPLIRDTYGLPFAATGPDWTNDGKIGRRLATALADGGNASFIAHVVRHAGDAIPDMAQAVGNAIDHFRPDFVVRDSTCVGSVIAGARRKIVTVAADVGVSDYTEIIGADLRALRERGAPPPSTHQASLLTPAPRGLILSDPAITAYRHEDPRRSGERLPAWAAKLSPDKPVVYASLGSLLTSGLAGLTLPVLRRTIDALATMDVSAVVSTGTPSYAELREYARAYDHIHITPFATQPLLLRAGVRAFVTHGGFNSVCEAVSHAVPMVCIPQTTDQPANARRLARLRLAVTLPQSPTTDAIRDAITDVITIPAYADAARKWQRTALALPPLSTAFDGLVRGASV